MVAVAMLTQRFLSSRAQNKKQEEEQQQVEVGVDYMLMYTQSTLTFCSKLSFPGGDGIHF